MTGMTGGACPNPNPGGGGCVLLAHGEGGRLMRELIAQHIAPPLGNDILGRLGDAAVLPPLSGPPVFTTDSYVVAPLEFPGGDIGSLAVFGTANDLAVSGARPRWISLSLIIEEGFALERLDRLLASAAQAAAACGVQVVTGDTKVVPAGAADGLFVNTAGIGEAVRTLPGPEAIEPETALLVSGPVGRHGTAVLVAREGLAFEPPPTSDSGPLWDVVAALHAADVPVLALRDATRGGVAAVLHEWAAACGGTLVVEGDRVPVTPDVRGVCELLGLDPLHVACEGTLVAAVPVAQADAALAALQTVPAGREAAVIGTATERRGTPVAVLRALGQLVPLDEPAGAPLPRIC